MPPLDGPEALRALIPHLRAFARTLEPDREAADALVTAALAGAMADMCPAEEWALVACAEARVLVARTQASVLATGELPAASRRNLARDAEILAVERGQVRDDRAMLERLAGDSGGAP